MSRLTKVLHPSAEEIQLFQQLRVFDIQYDIFLVAADGFLYFGSVEPDGSSEANRPVTLETSKFYTRQ